METGGSDADWRSRIKEAKRLFLTASFAGWLGTAGWLGIAGWLGSVAANRSAESMASHQKESAQASKKEQAAAFATQGIEAFEAKDFSAAIAQFEQAEKLYHAPTHWYYIARSYEEEGRFAEAYRHYFILSEESIDKDAPSIFVEVQKEAKLRMAKLRELVAFIRVKTPLKKGDELRIDGELVQAFSSLMYCASPGEHHLSLERGSQRYSQRQNLVASETFLLVELEGAKDSSASTTEESGGANTRSEADISPWTWVSLSVGALGLGTAIGFGVDSISKDGSADSAFSQCPNCDEEAISQLDQEAADAATAGLISLGIGLSGAAVGTFLLFDSQNENEATKTSASLKKLNATQENSRIDGFKVMLRASPCFIGMTASF